MRAHRTALRGLVVLATAWILVVFSGAARGGDEDRPLLQIRRCDRSSYSDSDDGGVCAGGETSFAVRVVNTGRDNEKIVVKENGLTRGFRTRYFYGGEDVTRKVRGGGWRIRDLRSGEAAELIMRVAAGDADVGAAGSVSLNGCWGNTVDFNVSNGCTVPCESYRASVTILGAAISYGTAYDMPVTAQINVGGTVLQPWGDLDAPVDANLNDGENPRTYQLPGTYSSQTAISVLSKAWVKRSSYYDGDQNSHWEVYRTVSSSPATARVHVLRDGDPVPQVQGYLDQQGIAWFVQDYVEDGVITLSANQTIYLFEYTNDLGAASADFQDLVVLVTLSEDESAPPEEPPSSTEQVWGIRNDTSALCWYDFADGQTFEHVEGVVEGLGSTTDVEALTCATDGTLYFMNNCGTSKLYSICATQLDRNAATPVSATFIGDTGLTAGSSDYEITSLQVIDGTLYGIGKKSKRIYSIDTSTGSATQVAPLNYPYAFRCDAMTAAPDGTVYVIRSKRSDSVLSKFASFPDGSLAQVCSLSGSGRVEALAAHPDGALYATDGSKWFKISPGTGSVQVVKQYDAPVQGMDFNPAIEAAEPPPDDDDDEGQEDDVCADVTVTPELSPFQPDVQACVLGGAYVGADVHSASGSDQMLVGTAKDREATVCLIKIENDGTETATYRLKEAGRSHSKWIVRTFDAETGGDEITDAVTGAGWSMGTVAPGASVTVRLAVVPGAEEPLLELEMDAICDDVEHVSDRVKITLSRPGRSTGPRLRIFRWLEK